MKKSKRIFAVLLTLVMVISVLPLSSVSSFAIESGAYEYYIISKEDKTCAISGITENYGKEPDLIIPSSIDGYTVVSIDRFSFNSIDFLLSVTIPDTVKSIGRYAFYYCDWLCDITLPDSITYIGDCAFSNTGYYHSSANWENGVLYIGNHIIDTEKNSSASYQIKPGTKTIATGAFGGFTALTSLIIPDSVTSIGEFAFDSCTSLNTIYGISGSLAETYAAENGYTFIDFKPGDLNGDGNVGIEDYALIKELMFMPNLTVDELAAADLNGDGVTDAFDLALIDLIIPA